MNCVKKLINGVINSPTSKRTLAWIVAVSMAFGGLTCTSFAENTDSSAIESSQDVDIVDGSEDSSEDDSDDASDSASEDAANEDVSIVDDSDEDDSTEESSTDDENTDIVVIDDSEDDSTEDASDAASSASSDDLIVIDDEEDVADDAAEGISSEKAAVVEVVFPKTFTYNGTAQQLTIDDFTVTVDGTAVDKTAYTLDPVTAQTNAGEYDAKITFTVEPYKTIVEGGAYSFKWTIAPMELTSVKISCDYSTTYGPTAKALASALLTKAKTDKKITITAGTSTLAIDDVSGFALAIEDGNGVIADADTVPNVGVYKLTVDLSSLSTNYKVSDANITKGKFTLKESTKITEDVVIAASFDYGKEVTATLKSSTTYNSVDWTLNKGQKASTATEVKKGTGISISGQLSLSLGQDLAVNTDGEYYFLAVIFKNATASKKVTKQFKVIAVQSSIANATISDPSGKNFKYEHTGSAITPTYTVTLNGATLVKDTDFTESGDISKTEIGGPYTVTLTGKGNYTGTKTFTWYIEEKKGPVTVKVKENYVYNKLAQGPASANDLQVEYNGNTVPATDIQSFDCVKQTDAGEYSGSFMLTDASKYPDVTNPVKFTWTIEQKPITITLKIGAQSQSYGKTADQLATSITKKITNSSVTIKNPDDSKDKITLKDLDGFAVAIADSEGEMVSGDVKLPVGSYVVVVDPEALDPNYMLVDGNEVKLTIKGKGLGTIEVNETSTYGEFSVKLSTSDYNDVDLEIMKGSSEDSAEEVSYDSSSIKVNTTFKIKLSALENDQHYYFVATFTELKDTKDAEAYEESYTTTKQVDVSKTSISDATLVAGTISSGSSSTSVEWKSDNNFSIPVTAKNSGTVTVKITSLTVNGTKLSSSDFTYEGDTSKSVNSSTSAEYTIKITGKGKYKDTKEVKWVVNGSSSSSSTQNEPKLAGNGSVTAVTKSSRLDTLAASWQNQNPNKKKVYTINVTSIDRSNISEQAEDIISGLRDSSVVVECYDITVNEKVSSASGLLESDRNVNEFDTAIDIALTLGKANTSKNLVVIREHGSETAEMVKLDRIPTSNTTEGFVVNNGKVTIYSRYFSNFTLVYTSNSSGASISGGAGPDDSSSSGSRAPRTGDNLPVLWIWVLVLFAGVILTSVAAYESLKANKVKAPAETKKKR